MRSISPLQIYFTSLYSVRCFLPDSTEGAKNKPTDIMPFSKYLQGLPIPGQKGLLFCRYKTVVVDGEPVKKREWYINHGNGRPWWDDGANELLSTIDLSGDQKSEKSHGEDTSSQATSS